MTASEDSDIMTLRQMSVLVGVAATIALVTITIMLSSYGRQPSWTTIACLSYCVATFAVLARLANRCALKSAVVLVSALGGLSVCATLILTRLL